MPGTEGFVMTDSNKEVIPGTVLVGFLGGVCALAGIFIWPWFHIGTVTFGGLSGMVLLGCWIEERQAREAARQQALEDDPDYQAGMEEAERIVADVRDLPAQNVSQRRV